MPGSDAVPSVPTKAIEGCPGASQPVPDHAGGWVGAGAPHFSAPEQRLRPLTPDPTVLQVIAPWRMPEFYNRFQGRNDLMEYAKVRRGQGPLPGAGKAGGAEAGRGTAAPFEVQVAIKHIRSFVSALRLPRAPFFSATRCQPATNSLHQSAREKPLGARTRKLLEVLNSSHRPWLRARSRQPRCRVAGDAAGTGLGPAPASH